MAAAVIAAPGTALAQSQEAEERSAEQIACDLSDDCAAPAVAVTRSWSLSKSGQSAAPTAPYAPRSTATTTRRPATQAMAASVGKRGLDTGMRRSSNLGINFALNSAELTPRGQRQADDLFKAVQSPQLLNKRYLIIGHTDASGDAAVNRTLSRMRAQALVEYLVGKGISRSRFRARGYGEDRLLANVKENSSLNRRVEIVKLD